MNFHEINFNEAFAWGMLAGYSLAVLIRYLE